MSLIRERPEYLWPGLALLASTAACGDLASVPYNAMLRQLSTPQNSGRISGLGLAARIHVAASALLLVVYFGFIAGKGATRGLLQLSAGDGMNVRMAMLLAAGWFAVFALPLLLTAHRLPSAAEAPSPARRRAGRLPQVLDGPGRRMAPRPQLGVFPAGRRSFSGWPGRRVHLRRRAGCQRLRDLTGRCADLRGGRKRGGGAGRRASAGCWTTGSDPSR